jgi:hypothetical protein
MAEMIVRVIQHLGERLDGPMHLRFFLQPAMSTLFAARDGIRDAKEHNPAYLWTVWSDKAHRRELLRNGWKGVGKVFLIAVLLDAIYQVMEFRAFYPGEALITASLLALVPYILLRGPINRVARRGLSAARPSRPA